MTFENRNGWDSRLTYPDIVRDGNRIATLLLQTELQPGESVLEVGCGTGVLCRWLASETSGRNPVMGVDVNTFFLREGSEIARREGVGDAVSFREGSAEQMPFDDNSFDAVFSSTVIQRVNADLMLPEMVRVARPGGRVAVLGHAHDMNRWVNLPLRGCLKRLAPGQSSQHQPGH